MFLREFVFKFVLFGLFLSFIAVNILDYLWVFVGNKDGSGHSQTLHDKMIKGSVYRVQGT
jgi:hypothetical protein